MCLRSVVRGVHLRADFCQQNSILEVNSWKSFCGETTTSDMWNSSCTIVHKVWRRGFPVFETRTVTRVMLMLRHCFEHFSLALLVTNSEKRSSALPISHERKQGHRSLAWGHTEGNGGAGIQTQAVRVQTPCCYPVLSCLSCFCFVRLQDFRYATESRGGRRNFGQLSNMRLLPVVGDRVRPLLYLYSVPTYWWFYTDVVFPLFLLCPFFRKMFQLQEIKALYFHVKDVLKFGKHPVWENALTLFQQSITSWVTIDPGLLGRPGRA